MAALSPILRSLEGGVVAFWCPGCDEAHAIRVDGPNAWQWDRNADRPTFSPSVLVTSGHYSPGHDGKSCWCTYNAAHPGEEQPGAKRFICGRCHSFVRDGQIQFLSDCTHTLAGQTVSLPEWPQ